MRMLRGSLTQSHESVEPDFRLAVICVLLEEVVCIARAESQSGKPKARAPTQRKKLRARLSVPRRRIALHHAHLH